MCSYAHGESCRGADPQDPSTTRDLSPQLIMPMYNDLPENATSFYLRSIGYPIGISRAHRLLVYTTKRTSEVIHVAQELYTLAELYEASQGNRPPVAADKRVKTYREGDALPPQHRFVLGMNTVIAGHFDWLMQASLEGIVNKNQAWWGLTTIFASREHYYPKGLDSRFWGPRWLWDARDMEDPRVKYAKPFLDSVEALLATVN